MQIDTEQVPRAHEEIKLSPADKARFWAKVNKSAGLDGCWPWTGCVNRSGYGKFRFCGKTVTAHRIAYIITHGQIPHDGSYHGTYACHRCDNPPCVNPAHLFLGSAADNAADKDAKGRNGVMLHPECIVRGEAHSSAKLTAAKVLEIRALYTKGKITYVQMSSRFGVSPSVIGGIIKRKIWKSI